jgi:TatD DNase family protein
MPIDSHVHIDAPEFDADRDAMLARARAAGIDGFVAPAVRAADWPRLATLAWTHADLHPAFGLHPMYLDAHRHEHLAALERTIADTRPVAVGECGIDHFVDGLDHEAQRTFFESQLAIAKAAGLPVIVHARRAVDEVIGCIRRIGGTCGVIHSFPGSLEQARQLHDLGFRLGFGGPVTYDRARRLRAVVAAIPLDQLLLETDSPDQPPSARRGERNEPSSLFDVAATIAALRGLPVEAVLAASDANARALFRLPEAPDARATNRPSPQGRSQAAQSASGPTTS